MRTEWIRFILVLLVYILLASVNSSGVKYYTNQWLVHVPFGKVAAGVVARSNNMKYEGPCLGHDGFYLMTKDDLSSKLSKHHEKITNSLNDHDLVTIAIQDAVKERSYRGIVRPRHVVPRDNMSGSSNFVQPRNLKSTNYEQSHYKTAFKDKRWNDMWYMHDYRKDSSEPVRDLNVVPVYKELKITGYNVNITVPDDGIEYTHPEIFPRYNHDLSWNYISNNDNINPDRDENGKLKAHGTRCAGQIVMQPNNECGVGIAYDALIGGIKFLDGRSTDKREANALKHALNYVCIYSNSWGPSDSGKIMENLSKVVQNSLSTGINHGRGGKGAIYVFAAGNGKSDGDNCACDGYVNSIYTIVVASCDDSGHVNHYSERCAAIMVTAYSGAGFEMNVLTTDVNKKCTDQHSGTSAATPLVSGIIALALSANPNLTWRDVQHLIAWTSQVAPLADNLGWNENYAGFYYSIDFGFGLINGYKLVKAAIEWKNVPEMSSCGIFMPSVRNISVTREKGVRIIVNTNACKGLSGEINYMESVQLVVSMSYPKRGDIQIAMTSPKGTQCHVLESRPKDTNSEGLNRWTFTILAFWGEPAEGPFKIDIFDTTGSPFNEGEISEVILAIHGTKDPPEHYKNGIRPYEPFNMAKPGDKPKFNYLSSHSSQRNQVDEDINENYLYDKNTRNII